TMESPSRPDLADLDGKAVGVATNVMAAIATRHMPSASQRSFASVPEMIESLCRGEIAFGVIGDSTAQSSSQFRKPEWCHLSLWELPQAGVSAGVGATRRNAEAALAADELRKQISSLARDGTLSSLTLKWYGQVSNETYMIDTLTKFRQ